MTAAEFKKAMVLSPFICMISLFPVLWFTWPTSPIVHWLRGWDAREWSRCGPHLCCRDKHTLVGDGSNPPVGRTSSELHFRRAIQSRWEITISSWGSWLPCLITCTAEAGMRLTSPWATPWALLASITNRKVSFRQPNSAFFTLQRLLLGETHNCFYTTMNICMEAHFHNLPTWPKINQAQNCTR